MWALTRLMIAFVSSDVITADLIGILSYSTMFLEWGLKAFVYTLIPAALLFALFHQRVFYGVEILVMTIAGVVMSVISLTILAGFPFTNVPFFTMHLRGAILAGAAGGATFTGLTLFTFVKRDNPKPEISPVRRRALGRLLGLVSVSGLVANGIGPFRIWRDSSKYQDIDVSRMEEGQMVAVSIAGRPVWVLRRSQTMLASLQEIDASRLLDPDSLDSRQPEAARNVYRAVNPEYFVVTGVCTHLGCAPSFKPEGDDNLGQTFAGPQFFCPCHGGVFDLAGRVFTGTPPPTNLDVPDYEFVSDTVIRVYYPGLSERWDW
jgi:ubiquinol-cytochrome c reductase iron-sulfur subunit